MNKYEKEAKELLRFIPLEYNCEDVIIPYIAQALCSAAREAYYAGSNTYDTGIGEMTISFEEWVKEGQ